MINQFFFFGNASVVGCGRQLYATRLEA